MTLLQEFGVEIALAQTLCPVPELPAVQLLVGAGRMSMQEAGLENQKVHTTPDGFTRSP